MIMKDRQKEFIESNKTICQDDCNLSEYNKTIPKANCSCKVKETPASVANMNINKTKLYENFGENNNKKEVSNLGVTSCNVLSSKDNIISNTGFYLLLLIMIVFIIIFVIFSTKGYRSLKNKIDTIIDKKFKMNQIKIRIKNKEQI